MFDLERAKKEGAITRLQKPMRWLGRLMVDRYCEVWAVEIRTGFEELVRTDRQGLASGFRTPIVKNLPTRMHYAIVSTNTSVPRVIVTESDGELEQEIDRYPLLTVHTRGQYDVDEKG